MSQPDSKDKDNLYNHKWFTKTFRLIAFMSLVLACKAGHSETAKWKVFSNRAGWSIDYPSDWKVTSCKSCSDPTDPKVFVDFFPAAEKDSDKGWLIVEHLADNHRV